MLPNQSQDNPQLMEVIRSAIEQAALTESQGPQKKRLKRMSSEREREKIIILRSASIFTFDEDDYVKEPNQTF